MKTVDLRYGAGTKMLTIPEDVDARVVRPATPQPVDDDAREIRRAMEEPIGSTALCERAHGAANAMVLVCDLTRDVPDGVIVPAVLDELNQAGIPDERITVMVAGGGHRPITEEEAVRRFGAAVLRRVELASHDSSDKASLVHIGTTSFGTPVWVNRRVAESDFVLGTGCIIPHVIAGYGGGRKLIIPGVAGDETIRRNHRPENVNHPGVGFCRVEGNVVHEELMEAARMARLDFVVNVVWDGEGRLICAVAGDMERAWEEGVRVAEAMYSVPLDRRFDLLVTTGGGAPTDITLYQAVRGLQVGLPAARDGAPIVLAAECLEGVGSDNLYTWLRDAETPADVLKRRDRDGFGIHGEHVACFLSERVFPRHSVYMVSSLPDAMVKEMMMIPQPTVDDALRAARREVATSRPAVLVNPYGPKVVPQLRGQDHAK